MDLLTNVCYSRIKLLDFCKIYFSTEPNVLDFLIFVFPGPKVVGFFKKYFCQDQKSWTFYRKTFLRTICGILLNIYIFQRLKVLFFFQEIHILGEVTVEWWFLRPSEGFRSWGFLRAFPRPSVGTKPFEGYSPMYEWPPEGHLI